MHVLLDTFVRRGGNLRTMSNAFDDWNALSNTLGAAKFGIYVTQVLIGDSFMVRYVPCLRIRMYLIASCRRIAHILCGTGQYASSCSLSYYLSGKSVCRRFLSFLRS